jgi:hypothetical protein
MPPGVPVATMAIGKAGAKNSAIFSAQIIGRKDPEVAKKLKDYKIKMAKEVEKKAKALHGHNYWKWEFISIVFPYFLRQTIIALRLGTKDESLHETILKSVFEIIRETDTSKPAAYTTIFIHKKIRHLLGTDPFKKIKSEYNQVALRLYPSLKTIVEKSSDPWVDIPCISKDIQSRTTGD